MAAKTLHEPNDETVDVDCGYGEIAFNLSLARRIVAQEGFAPSRFRVTQDGTQRLVGERAKFQGIVDGLPAAIVGTVMQRPIVLEGQDRIHGAPGNPRYFPAYVLGHDETRKCVVPSSRGAYERLCKILGSPAT